MQTYTNPSLFKKASLKHVAEFNASIERAIFNESVDAEYDDVIITNGYIESLHDIGAYE